MEMHDGEERDGSAEETKGGEEESGLPAVLVTQGADDDREYQI